MRVGDTLVDLRLSAYWNVEVPESAADWRVQQIGLPNFR